MSVNLSDGNGSILFFCLLQVRGRVWVGGLELDGDWKKTQGLLHVVTPPTWRGMYRVSQSSATL